MSVPPPAPHDTRTPLSPGTVPNHLVWAILATLFCCLPLGIVSIVKSVEVNGKLAAGDLAGAQESSDAAKKWAIWAAGVTAVLLVIYVILMMLGAVAGAL